MTTKMLLLAASLSIAAPLSAQQSTALPDAPTATSSESPPPEATVEGDTPERVAQVQRCEGYKFESLVEIDPVEKSTTRVKLCANPGASDADWVKTLEAAVAQIEQRDMPPEARQKLIGEMRIEISKYAATSNSAETVPGVRPLVTDPSATASLAGPSERFETSILPPLAKPNAAGAATAAIPAISKRPMRIALKCLERGQTGTGETCDLLKASTILAVSAVEGVEDGGRLRFRRRGEVRGEVVLAPMRPGQLARVKLPTELCRAVINSKVEIELVGPEAAGSVAARLGPYDLRC
ncbi:MAG: hypothetical protein ABIR25_04130 [Sphingomicrobium sp.]